jgi:hypothetical protein
MSQLGAVIQGRRLRRGLTLGQLARLVGYRNLSKGARRLACLEHTGTSTPDLLVNVAEALDMDRATVERLADEDRQERLREWESWVSAPTAMHLVVRLMAAVYATSELPTEVTTQEQAETWACTFARQHRFRVCLVLSRRWSVWIDALGHVEARTEATPGEPNVPFMRVRGRCFLLEG